MSLYEFGPFQLDAARLLLLERDNPLPIGPKVVETLLALLEHPGETLAKAALLERVWPEGYVDEASLAQNVYVLRKLMRARWNAAAIETVPRRGYRFVAPVHRRELTPPARSLRGAAVAFCALVVGVIVVLATAVPHGAPQTSNLSTDGARLLAIGQYYWNLRTRDGVAKSVEYFSRVVATNPQSARGYAALASADAVMADYRYGPQRPHVYVARAKAYARKALAIDSQCAQAYAVLGMLASEPHEGVPPQMGFAIEQLRRAIAIDPANGPAREWYGIALLQEGSVAAAYGELRQAAELDPLSVPTAAWLGTAAYLDRRYADAIAYARETLDLSPQRGDAFETLGLAYEALGNSNRAAAAFAELARSCAECRAEAAALLAALYARGHDLERARSELTIAQAHSDEVAPPDLAVALAAIGRRGDAVSWLRRSRGEYWQAVVANDPRFAALHLGAPAQPLQKPA